VASKCLNKWQRVPIKETYLGLYDGPHATPQPASSGPVFLGIKNITDDGRLNFSEIRHIDEDEYPRWTKRVEPQPNDIVFTYEATLNRYAIIPTGFRGCLGRRLALIRPNPNKVDTRFLFYYFFGADWRATISRNMLSGSTVDRIPLTSFPEFQISMPPLEVQQKIASILTTYDDLIENNTRRIKILEEMAQNLFREWFVHFRFPGHEKVKMVDSPLGKIPEGWDAAALADVAEVIDCLHSKKPKEAQESEQHGIFLQVWNIGDNGKIDLTKKYFINEVDYRQWTKRIEANGGDCVITNVGRIGAVAQIPEGVTAAIGRNMTAIRPKIGTLQPTYLIEYLLSPHMEREKGRKKDAGTIMDSLNVKGIIKLRIPIPPFELMTRYEEFARPIRRRIEILQKQNSLLHRTRDLLLPKLISGEVRVEA